MVAALKAKVKKQKAKESSGKQHVLHQRWLMRSPLSFVLTFAFCLFTFALTVGPSSFFFDPPFFAPPFFPPFFEDDLSSFLPRPEPLFLPPPEALLTVPHARRSASFFDVPRFSYPSSMCSALRFCFDV